MDHVDERFWNSEIQQRLSQELALRDNRISTTQGLFCTSGQLGISTDSLIRKNIITMRSHNNRQIRPTLQRGAKICGGIGTVTVQNIKPMLPLMPGQWQQ